MNLKIFQKGFHYAQDGQGNRLVYHLQGCNMNCKWCANPEGMKMEGVICTDKDWLTDGLCPEGAVKDGTLAEKAIDEACLRVLRWKLELGLLELTEAGTLGPAL